MATLEEQLQPRPAAKVQTVRLLVSVDFDPNTGAASLREASAYVQIVGEGETVLDLSQEATAAQKTYFRNFILGIRDRVKAIRSLP